MTQYTPVNPNDWTPMDCQSDYETGTCKINVYSISWL